MYGIRKEDMMEIDNKLQSKISPYKLMDMAGCLMSKVILNKYPNIKKVLAVTGKGGNAADGIVCLKYLMDSGIDVYLYKAYDIDNEDTLLHLSTYKGKTVDDLNSDYDLIIDAIFGIGYKPKEHIDLFDLINSLNIPVVSLDIPSGIDSNNGLSSGSFIKSDLCICVEYPKIGMLLNDGLDSFKEFEVITLGMEASKSLICIASDSIYKNVFKPRIRNSNKGSYGKAAIIGGSYRYSGAPILAINSLSSYMMGVGYSALYLPASLYDKAIMLYPELIIGKLEENNGVIKYDENALSKLLSYDSIAIGMGASISHDLYNIIKYLLDNYDKNLIIDADGLNTIVKYGIDILENHNCNVILTPHIMEFSRLLNMDKNYVMGNVISLAEEFSKKYKVITVVKSASSVITNGMDTIISISGNDALAKSGSGDTLSGLLCGILAQNEANITNVSFASYLLGEATVMASKNIDKRCIRLNDIIAYYSDVLKRIN